MGSYYENEMQLASPAEAHLQHWEIDKILDVKERKQIYGSGTTTEYLIKWKHHDGRPLSDDFNDWVPYFRLPHDKRPSYVF
jgi:hypothetical protein